MTELIGSSGFSRRNFIKGAAVFGTAGVLAGCKPKTDDKTIDDDTPHEIVPSPDVLKDAADYPGEADYVIMTTKVLPTIDRVALLRPVIRSPRTVFSMSTSNLVW